MNNPKLSHILMRLNATYITPLMEPIRYDFKPTIEHLMPQSWVAEWKLPG